MKRQLALTLATVTLIAGCGSSGSKTIPTVAPTTSTTLSSEQAVLGGYRAFWDDYLAVTNPMTPGSPRIPAHTTAAELNQLNGTVVAESQNHHVYRGTIDLASKVESSSADSATVLDCPIDRTGIYSTTDGSRVDTEDLTPQNLRVQMQLVGGVWKVASIDHRSDPCTP